MTLCEEKKNVESWHVSKPYVVHGDHNKEFSLAIPHGGTQGIILGFELIGITGNGSVSHKLPFMTLLECLLLQIVWWYWTLENKVVIGELNDLLGLVPSFLSLGYNPRDGLRRRHDRRFRWGWIKVLELDGNNGFWLWLGSGTRRELVRVIGVSVLGIKIRVGDHRGDGLAGDDGVNGLLSGKVGWVPDKR
jgi:hypothetical protein